MGESSLNVGLKQREDFQQHINGTKTRGVCRFPMKKSQFSEIMKVRREISYDQGRET